MLDLTNLDAQQRLACFGQHACIVMGQLVPEVDVRLVPLGDETAVQTVMSLEGFRFAGVIAMTAEGTAQAAPNDHIDAKMLMLCALNDYAAFVARKEDTQRCASSSTPAKRDDVSWLRRLFALPDLRDRSAA